MVRKIGTMAKTLVISMKNHNFNPTEYTTILSFLTSLKSAFDAKVVHERAEMCLFKL